MCELPHTSFAVVPGVCRLLYRKRRSLLVSRGMRVALSKGMEPSTWEFGTRAVELASLWRALVAGRYFVTAAYCGQDRCFLELERRRIGRRASELSVNLLARMLAGEAQKVLACEFDVSLTTIAVRCADALRVMVDGYYPSRAPILLVMAAHAERGLRLPVACARRVAAGRFLVSAELPGAGLAHRLSPGELHVARLLIEGKAHMEIARTRGTAVRTTANQLRAVFGKLRVSGRSELRAKAIGELSETHLRSLALGTGSLGPAPRTGPSLQATHVPSTPLLVALAAS